MPVAQAFGVEPEVALFGGKEFGGGVRGGSERRREEGEQPADSQPPLRPDLRRTR